MQLGNFGEAVPYLERSFFEGSGPKCTGESEGAALPEPAGKNQFSIGVTGSIAAIADYSICNPDCTFI